MSPGLKLSKEQLLALKPDQVRLYLLSHGWREDINAASAKATVYRYPGEPHAVILVPRSQELADYAHRMGDVAEMIAAVEQRKIWEVLADLSALPGSVTGAHADVPKTQK